MTSGKQADNIMDPGFDYGYQSILLTGFQYDDADALTWKFSSSWGANWGYSGNGSITNDIVQFQAIYQLEL